jgi:hypothetical protein
MGCCNEPGTALATAAPDPTQHVNYAKGMVLGVDDFTQEYAYLAGRGQWAARESIGYGTLSGLRISVEDAGASGPRLRVSSGTALVPSGKLVCVPGDQCALIDAWLAKRNNAAAVTKLLNPDADVSPPEEIGTPAVTSGQIGLYLTLCYTDCTTRAVPVPGEPCRTDDQLMTDSRVADDFRLQIRTSAPAQVEEDALRDFVQWIGTNVEVVDPGSAPGDSDATWLEALRPAAQPWFDAAAMSPPMSPPASVATLGDYLMNLSPPDLVVARDRVCDFARVVFRFWVTELRPLWMAWRCHRAVVGDQDCVLLARVVVKVLFAGGSPVGVWESAGGASTIAIDETTRPFLTHLRLLQEWMLCGLTGSAGAGSGGGTGGGTGGGGGSGGGGGGGGGTASMPRVPIRLTNADLTLGDTDYCVVCRQPANTVKLPKSTGNAGRVYVVKNLDIETPSLVILAATGDKIDGTDKREFTKGRSLTIVADGVDQWHIISRVP